MKPRYLLVVWAQGKCASYHGVEWFFTTKKKLNAWLKRPTVGKEPLIVHKTLLYKVTYTKLQLPCIT